MLFFKLVFHAASSFLLITLMVFSQALQFLPAYPPPVKTCAAQALLLSLMTGLQLKTAAITLGSAYRILPLNFCFAKQGGGFL